MKNIIIVNFFFLFFLSSYLHAETISTATTQTSSKTITEDLTITSTGSINCSETEESEWSNCIKIKDNSTGLTIINRGTLNDSTEDSDKDTIIRADDPEQSDLTIKNYGTIESTGNSTLFLTDMADGDGDGISAYVYNEGTITATRAYTVRFDGSDDFKIDNYGTITNTNSSGQTIFYQAASGTLSGFILNNYAGGTISAPNSGGCSNDSNHLGAINAKQNVTGSTINNWGTITAKCDTMRIGASSTLNNYGTIEATSDPSYLSIETNGDDNILNFYDGTLIIGTIDADDDSGNTLNFNLCSSYNYYLTGSWTVNDKSGCGSMTYANGYAKSVSALFQSVADELSALRIDHINDAFDIAREMKEGNVFTNYSSSFTDRDGKKSIDEFSVNKYNVVFGQPFNNNQIKGHQVFNFSTANIDLLNQRIDEETFQAGLFLDNDGLNKNLEIGFKSIFGLHNYNGKRTQLDNTVATGKNYINQNFHSFSSIIGTQINKSFSNEKSSSYIKSNLDTNFDMFLKHKEDSHVKWNSRLLGQFMSDITYGWKNKQSVGKIYLNPEFTVGFRTIITGKEQKFSFDDTKSSFNGGIQEDAFGKFSLVAKYLFNQNANLFFKTSAKKTTEGQETFVFNIGFKSIF